MRQHQVTPQRSHQPDVRNVRLILTWRSVACEDPPTPINEPEAPQLDSSTSTAADRTSNPELRNSPASPLLRGDSERRSTRHASAGREQALRVHRVGAKGSGSSERWSFGSCGSELYNFQRPHQGIGGLVPADRFFSAAADVLGTLKARVAANSLE